MGSVKGVLARTNGEESSSLQANTAYVFDLGNDTKVIPILQYLTDFDNTNSFGAGFEIQAPFGVGDLRATFMVPDFEKAEDVSVRIGYTVQF